MHLQKSFVLKITTGRVTTIQYAALRHYPKQEALTTVVTLGGAEMK